MLFILCFTQETYESFTNIFQDKDLCFLERLNFSDFGLRLEDDDRIKSSLLNNAIFSGKFAKVTSLVQSGVSVNVVDYNNRSPLVRI